MWLKNMGRSTKRRDLVGIAILLLLLPFAVDALSANPPSCIRRHQQSIPTHHTPLTSRRTCRQTTVLMSSRSSTAKLTLPLLSLASNHFISQAVHTFVKLGLPDVLICGNQDTESGDSFMTLEDIAEALGPNTNRDALLRTLRLLTTVDILEDKMTGTWEDECDGASSVRNTIYQNVAFRLTDLGATLQSSNKGVSGSGTSLASCVLHWMEEPLWNVGFALPAFIQGNGVRKYPTIISTKSSAQNAKKNDDNEIGVKDPFTMVNGQSSDYYYNKEEHPQSLSHANDFVRFIADNEINAIVDAVDWSSILWSPNDSVAALDGNDKVSLLDIGGYNGKVLDAISTKYPSIECKCLDLPHVIEQIEENNRKQAATAAAQTSAVTLIGGNIFDDVSTLPNDCNVILMKHFLDRCMWDEKETLLILQTCYNLLPSNSGSNRLVLAEAVIPDPGPNDDVTTTSQRKMQLTLDALYMFVGRERQRTKTEWITLVSKANFALDEIIHTELPTCSLLVLHKK